MRAEGLDGEVDCFGRAVASFGEIEAFKNVEDFDQRRAARRRGRSSNDVVPSVGAADRFALLDLVGGEVGGRDDASTSFDGSGEFTGKSAMVEVIGIFCDALEGAGQFGLLQDLAGLVE